MSDFLRSDWPITKRLWKVAHNLVNRLAWRYGMEPGWRHGMYGSGLHLNHEHWTWRLNSWIGSHWIDWWMRRPRQEAHDGE